MMLSRPEKIILGFSVLGCCTALVLLGGGVISLFSRVTVGQNSSGSVIWMLGGGVLLLTSVGVWLYLWYEYRLEASERDRNYWWEQAMIDGFTGISHKQRMHELVEAAVTVASCQPRTLLLMDIDDLKSINDRYGHGEGDAAILCLVALLKPLFPEPNRLGRVGGDEFMVLAYTDENDALARMHTLFDSLRTHDAASENMPPLSVSVGLVVIPAEGLSVDEAYCRADHAMYCAKRQEGSAVVVQK